MVKGRQWLAQAKKHCNLNHNSEDSHAPQCFCGTAPLGPICRIPSFFTAENSMTIQNQLQQMEKPK